MQSSPIYTKTHTHEQRFLPFCNASCVQESMSRTIVTFITKSIDQHIAQRHSVESTPFQCIIECSSNGIVPFQWSTISHMFNVTEFPFIFNCRRTQKKAQEFARLMFCILLLLCYALYQPFGMAHSIVISLRWYPLVDDISPKKWCMCVSLVPAEFRRARNALSSNYTWNDSLQH